MSDSWQERSRPVRLEKRFRFPDYDALRDFLDRAADLSERVDYYPDMGFGRDYLNVTIHADDGDTELSEDRQRLSRQLDELLDDNAA